MEELVLEIRDTTATKKVFALKKRIRAVAGGAGASKTISILIWNIDYAQSNRRKTISIVSETFPHLEKGAIKDFKLIMQDRGYWKDSRWNESKHVYKFETGSIMEFFSVDTLGKSRGPRRNVLFMNEVNNIAYPIARQLILRTKEVVWMDWNRSEEFWYEQEFENKRDDIDFLQLTYLDNEGLDEGERQEIERLRGNKYLWAVYGLGELGVKEGQIYTNWQLVDEVPKEAELLRHWLDFGYSNDPTAIGDLYYLNGAYYLDEQAYLKGLSNKDIADRLNNLRKALTVADSAEPKSIDELRSYGVNVVESPKGPGSVNQQISVVQGETIFVTKRSLNIIKEYRNWVWMTDKNGTIINVPMEAFDHHMKGIGYAMATLAPMLRRKEMFSQLPQIHRKPKEHPTR